MSNHYNLFITLANMIQHNLSGFIWSDPLTTLYLLWKVDMSGYHRAYSSLIPTGIGSIFNIAINSEWVPFAFAIKISIYSILCPGCLILKLRKDRIAMGLSFSKYILLVASGFYNRSTLGPYKVRVSHHLQEARGRIAFQILFLFWS